MGKVRGKQDGRIYDFEFGVWGSVFWDYIELEVDKCAYFLVALSIFLNSCTCLVI